MHDLILVGSGGFLGCYARFLIARFFILPGHAFPWSTLAVNILAGFLIGFFTTLDRETNFLPARTKLFFATGFLGGLSTFSTFSQETVTLLSDGLTIHAAANVILNVVLSLAGVLLGSTAAALVVR